MEKEHKSLNSDIKPSFYILTLAHRTPIDRQLIPPDFMNYVTEELGESATLSVPLGRHWDIQLQKTEKGVYLQNGWKEFLKDNNLGNNEFLVFTYCGDMCFDVVIFEKTGCERVYRSTFTNGEQYPQENLENSSFPIEKRKRGRPKKIENNPPKKIEYNFPKKIGNNPPKKMENNPPMKLEKYPPKKMVNNPPMKLENNPPLVGEKRKRGRPRKIVGGTSGIPHTPQPSEYDSDMDVKPDMPLGSIGRPVTID